MVAFTGDSEGDLRASAGERTAYEIPERQHAGAGERISKRSITQACENLARDVEFVIGNTWYGAFGIIADGLHEASSLMLQAYLAGVCG